VPLKKKPSIRKAAATGDELTLRLDGNLITPEDFKKATQAFVNLIISVTEDMAKGGKKPVWNMSVREGSAVLVARPVADTQTRKTARAAIKRVKTGIGDFEKGKLIVGTFSPRAMYAIQEIASLPTRLNKAGITTVEFGGGKGKQVPVTHKTAEFLKKNLGAQRSAYGAIEGKLSTISERGTFQFVVFDSIADRGVNCFVPEGMFKDAHSAFGKRVSVFGNIQYDRDGKPLSIKVENIRVFRDPSELPPLDSFIGILKSA
jgi:hypothetical protein